VSFATVTLCAALNECLLLLFISLSTQSGNFWIHPRKVTTSQTRGQTLRKRSMMQKYVTERIYIHSNELVLILTKNVCTVIHLNVVSCM
jgi:hypothetical protein